MSVGVLGRAESSHSEIGGFACRRPHWGGSLCGVGEHGGAMLARHCSQGGVAMMVSHLPDLARPAVEGALFESLEPRVV